MHRQHQEIGFKCLEEKPKTIQGPGDLWLTGGWGYEPQEHRQHGRYWEIYQTTNSYVYINYTASSLLAEKGLYIVINTKNTCIFNPAILTKLLNFYHAYLKVSYQCKVLWWSPSSIHVIQNLKFSVSIFHEVNYQFSDFNITTSVSIDLKITMCFSSNCLQQNFYHFQDSSIQTVH